MREPSYWPVLLTCAGAVLEINALGKKKSAVAPILMATTLWCLGTRPSIAAMPLRTLRLGHTSRPLEVLIKDLEIGVWSNREHPGAARACSRRSTCRLAAKGLRYEADDAVPTRILRIPTAEPERLERVRRGSAIAENPRARLPGDAHRLVPLHRVDILGDHQTTSSIPVIPLGGNAADAHLAMAVISGHRHRRKQQWQAYPAPWWHYAAPQNAPPR